MTKDVFVSVEGMHFSQQAEPGKVEIINAGSYYKKNDYHYVLYDEAMEGFDQVTRNMIKFRDGEVLLHKKGVINADMLFEENKTNSSCYMTPFGEIMMNINTTAVDILEREDKIILDVGYTLEVGYEELAQCRIHIRVSPRAEGAKLLDEDYS